MKSNEKYMMKNKKSLLRILKISNLYGGLLSLITVIAYLLLMFLFPGTFRYLPIQVVLLPTGIISVTVFSCLHPSYYEIFNILRYNVKPGQSNGDHSHNRKSASDSTV